MNKSRKTAAFFTVNPAGFARPFGKERLKDTSRATFMRFLWGAEADAADDNLSSSMRGRPPWLPSARQLPAAPFKPTWEPCRGCTDLFIFWYGLCIPSVTLQVQSLGCLFCTQKGTDLKLKQRPHYRENIGRESMYRENERGCFCFPLSAPTMQWGK